MAELTSPAQGSPLPLPLAMPPIDEGRTLPYNEDIDPYPAPHVEAVMDFPPEEPEDIPMQIDFDDADINVDSESSVPPSPTSSSIFSSSSSVWPDFFSEDEHSNSDDPAEPAVEGSDSDVPRLASKRKYHPTLSGI